MSRKDEIEVIGQYLGLAAGHFAAWGAKWRETAEYGARVQEKIRKITLNEDEQKLLREIAVKRAKAYLESNAREGKIEGKELTRYLEIAEAEIERTIGDYVNSLERKREQS